MLGPMRSTATAMALDAWLAQEVAAEIVRETVRALGPCAKVMPLKGTLLARTHYRHASERPMRDCDVLLSGLNMREAIGRLGAHGYQLFEWSNAADVVTLLPPGGGTLLLDVHLSPLPYGLGCVDSAWMMDEARLDEELFGVPVHLPAPSRLLVHLLGNVLKDHVYRAFAHTVRDISRVLEAPSTDLSQCAHAIRAARLRLGSYMALERVADEAGQSARRAATASETGSERARRLMTMLDLAPAERREAARRLSVLRKSSSRPTLVQRLVARTSADTRADRVRAVCAAGFGVCASTLRNREARRGMQGRSGFRGLHRGDPS